MLTSRPEMIEEQAALVEAARAGDKGAWTSMFTDYYQPLYRYALVRIRDHHAAEEMAAQVFEEAYRGIKGFDYRGVSIRAWLFRIARNLTADYRRKVRKLNEAPLVEFSEARDEIDAIGERTDVLRAVRELREDQQNVILLRFMQGLSRSETAHALGRSPDAITALQARAVAELRKKMDAPEPRGGHLTDGVRDDA